MGEASVCNNRDSVVGACPTVCPRHAALRPILIGVAWLAAAVASLSVAAIPYDFGESLCGVWGCFPPITALAAMHLFWCVVFGAIVWAVRRWRPSSLRVCGMILLLIATVATAVFVGRDLYEWLEWMPAVERHYWPRRVAYLLLTLTDIPLVQSLIAGVVCIVLGGRPVRPGIAPINSGLNRAAPKGLS
jgi:hypothetical protein